MSKEVYDKIAEGLNQALDYARSPTLLRTAIERIAPEKPSDYTLVMEEVGRMEAEERSDETLIDSVGLSEPVESVGVWRLGNGSLAVAGYHFGRSGDPFMTIPPDERYTALLTASEAFIREAEEMGWGKTSDKALPGAFDALVEAVRQTRTGAPS